MFLTHKQTLPQTITPTTHSHHYICPKISIISLHATETLLGGSQVHNQKGDDGDYAKEQLPNNSNHGSSETMWNE